jgi:sugar phosphate isomerase/epimerase
MKLEMIVDAETLEQYRSLTAQHIGVQFPVEYLNKGKVYIIRDKDRQIVGGFAMILEPPFRAIESIPKHERWRVLDELWRVGFSLCELTGFWLASDHRGKREALAFWQRMMLALREHKRTSLVYAYNVDNPKLAQLYGIMNPRELYRGPTVQLEGMAEADIECVEIADVKQAVDYMARRHQRIFETTHQQEIEHAPEVISA